MNDAEIERLLQYLHNQTAPADQMNEINAKLYEWFNSPASFEYSVKVFANRGSYRETLVIQCLIIIRRKITESWTDFTEEMIVNLAQLLLQCIDEYRGNTNHNYYRYSLLSLIDISILSPLPQFKMPGFMGNNFPESYYLEFLNYYLEEFSYDFVKKYFDSKLNEEIQAMLLYVCPQVLMQNPTSYTWLNTFLMFLPSTQDFVNFNWAFEHFYQAFGNEDQIKILIEIIGTCFAYQNDLDAEFYFNLYGLFLRLSVHLREAHIEDQDFTQIMNLWYNVLQTETNYLTRPEFGGILQSLLEEFNQVIDTVPIDNENWDSLLYQLNRFIQAFTDDDVFIKEVLEIVFTQLVKILEKDTSRIYKEVINCFNEIWNPGDVNNSNQQTPEMVKQALQIRESLNQMIAQMLQNPSPVLFSTIAHLWTPMKTDIQYRQQLGLYACNVLLEMGEYPPSTLFFIKKVGRKYPEFTTQFVNIIAEEFYDDTNNFSQKVLFQIITRHKDAQFEIGPQLFQFLVEGKNLDPYDTNLEVPYNLCSVIYLLSLYESDDIGTGVHGIILEGLENVVENGGPSDIEKALSRLKDVADKCSRVVKNEWFNSFAQQVVVDARNVLEKVLLLDISNIQESLVDLAISVAKILGTSISEMLAQWLDAVIQNSVFQDCHYRLAPYVAQFLPMQSLQSLIASINVRASDEKSCYQTHVLAQSLKEMPILWTCTPLEMIIDMLTVAHEETQDRTAVYLTAAQAITNRVQDTSQPPLDTDFVRAAIFNIARGLNEVYTRFNISPMLVHIQSLIQFVGPDEFRCLMAQGTQLSSNEFQELVESLIEGRKPNDLSQLIDAAFPNRIESQ